MKRRRGGGGLDAGSRSAISVTGGPIKKQQQGKSRRRLGGGGLSLEAFAAAKSKPLINPAQIREHREFYKNAKKIQKYKKLVKHIGGEGQSALPKRNEDAADRLITEQDSEVVNDDDIPKKGTTGFVRKKFPVLKTDGKQFKAYRKQAQQQKSTSQMEKIREEADKEKLEKEEQRKKREELYAEQQEARDKARHERKEVQVRLRKKTHRGQPVMKHRMEQLLETIQRGS